MSDFEWAVFGGSEKGGKYKTAYCKICSEQQFWPPSFKPRSFLKSKPKLSRKNGTFDIRNFLDHSKGSGHQHACRKGNKTLFDTKAWSNFRTSEKVDEQNFSDFVIFLVMCDNPLSQVETWARIQQFRGQNFPNDRKKAVFIPQAIADYLTSQQHTLLSQGDAFCLGLDDGSDVGSREWCAVVMKAGDTKNISGVAKDGMFLLGLEHVQWNELDAKGLLSVVEKICAPYLSKVFWVARDGANVMRLFADLFVAKYNPFALDFWCSNHRGNLLLKDIVFEHSNFPAAIDHLHRMDKYFAVSGKAKNRFQSNFADDHSGPQTFGRVENLTRWLALKLACDKYLALVVIGVRTILQQISDRADLRGAMRKRLAKSLVESSVDYRMLASIFVLQKIGQAFQRFHLQLQAREADFTTVNLELHQLKVQFSALSDPKFVRNTVENIESLQRQFEEVFQEQSDVKLDMEAPPEDFETENATSVVAEEVAEAQKHFDDFIDLRFDENSCEITAAFSIFDPQNFPNFQNLSSKERAERSTKYGNTGMKTLAEWYGDDKKVGENVFPAVINKDKIFDQWASFKGWMFEAYDRGSFETYRELALIAVKMARSNLAWARAASEILVLLEIIACKMLSTSENERVFSKVTNIATAKRTSLSDENVKCLVKSSFEMKKLYKNPGEAVSIAPAIKKYVDLRREKQRRSSALAMRQSRKRKVGSESNEDVEEKDVEMEDLPKEG